jgi:ABC-type glycerol-3-phosphate transport system permease component
MAACGTMALVPIIVVYLLMQRQFIVWHTPCWACQ